MKDSSVLINNNAIREGSLFMGGGGYFEGALIFGNSLRGSHLFWHYKSLGVSGKTMKKSTKLFRRALFCRLRTNSSSPINNEHSLRKES